jgi:hypothetical protein
MQKQTKHIQGIVLRIGELKTGGTGKKKWEKRPIFIENPLTGENEWITVFGEMPKEIQKSYDNRSKFPPTEIDLVYAISGDQNQYKNYESCRIISEKIEPKEIKPAEFIPASEIKPFRDMLTGELVTLQQIANDAFKMAYNRDPKTDGEFQIVYGLQYVAGKHWAVEKFLRSKGSMTIEQIYMN